MGDVDGKKIHFGAFIRWHRLRKGWSLRELGDRSGGISEKRIWQLERMAEPKTRETTLARIANAFGIDPEQFESVWRSMPVMVPKEDASDPFAELDALVKRLGLTPEQVVEHYWKDVQQRPSPGKGEVVTVTPQSRRIPPSRKGSAGVVASSTHR